MANRDSIDEVILNFIRDQQSFNEKALQFFENQTITNHEQAKVNNEQAKTMNEQTKTMKKILRVVEEFKFGLGKGFERYNKAVVVVSANHKVDAKSIAIGKKFADPEGVVNPINKEVEVDIFCSSPLIVGECTTYLDSDELEKVHRFIKTIAFIEKLHNEKPHSYFFTYGIHEDIRHTAQSLLMDANITLVCGEN